MLHYINQIVRNISFGVNGMNSGKVVEYSTVKVLVYLQFSL